MADENPERPDLVDRRIDDLRSDPKWARRIFIAIVFGAIMVFWKNFTGETIGQSLMRVPALFASEEPLADCLATATTVQEISECHQKH